MSFTVYMQVHASLIQSYKFAKSLTQWCDMQAFCTFDLLDYLHHESWYTTSSCEANQAIISESITRHSHIASLGNDYWKFQYNKSWFNCHLNQMQALLASHTRSASDLMSWIYMLYMQKIHHPAFEVELRSTEYNKIITVLASCNT